MSQAAALPDVIREFERVDPKIVEEARNTRPRSWPTSPAARRLSGRIAPLSPTMKFAGPALTVEVVPATT
jgi:hypothetical protein